MNVCTTYQTNPSYIVVVLIKVVNSPTNPTNRQANDVICAVKFTRLSLGLEAPVISCFKRLLPPLLYLLFISCCCEDLMASDACLHFQYKPEVKFFYKIMLFLVRLFTEELSNKI